MVESAPLLEVVDEESLLAPLNISRNKIAITKLNEETWAPTCCPVVISLFGNMCSGLIKADDDSVLDMANAYYSLVWHSLNAVQGCNKNGRHKACALIDHKDLQKVIRDQKHFLFKSRRIYLNATPAAEESTNCMKETRARRREMQEAN